MDKFLTVSENDKCCKSCKDDTTQNCNCNSCTPLKIDNADIRQAKCVNLNLDRIVSCNKVCERDASVNTMLTFNVNESNDDYFLNSPVCIKRIGLSYDYIGLAFETIGNSEAIIDGETFILDPQNLFNVGTEANPFYLFNILTGTISLENHCCCDLNPNTPRLIRVIETENYFEVSNLNIYAEGYIGCMPFTATSTVDNVTRPADGVIRLTSLGLVSSSTFDTRVCIPDISKPINIREVFDFELNVDCIRPSTRYILLPDGGTGFNASVDFSFNVCKSVYILNREGLSVYSNMLGNMCPN